MRIAAAFAGLNLLLAPVKVSAECAWLLWSSYRTKIEQHAIERAFETRRDCEGAIQDAVQQNLRAYRSLYETANVSPRDPAVVIARGLPDSPRKQTEGDTVLIRVSCWPLGLQPSSASGGAEYPKR